MDTKTIAAIAALTETAVTEVVKLYRYLEDNSGGTVKPLTDVLTDADKAYDDVIKTASDEIAKQSQAPAKG